MKRKGYLLLTVILLSATSLMACSNKDKDMKNNTEAKSNIESENVKSDKVKAEPEKSKEIEIPNKSQKVSSFPWDEDKTFKSAQNTNNTDVLIAGFCTVLEKATPAEKVNIGLAAKTVNGTVVQPGEVFSQNESVGPYTEERGYQEGHGYVGNKVVKSMGGGVCKVATTLYNTSVLSNVEIVERYNHVMPVPYVPYGQDAAVAFGSKDFKFKNNTENPILIWAQVVDNRVYMGFYGKEEAPEVKWEHETISKRTAPIEYKNNPELTGDEENVIVEGMDGEVVKSHVIIKDDDGNEQLKELGKSSYWPMPHLIEANK